MTHGGPLTNLSEGMKETLVLSLREEMNVTSRDLGPMLEEKIAFDMSQIHIS